MRRVLVWTVGVLCCTARAQALDAGTDVRLVEAQTALDEALKLRTAGRYADAIQQVERALALRETVLGGANREVAECLNKLGDLYRLQGDFTQAEPLLKRGLALREAALGKDHPDVAGSLQNLAILYREQGLYSRAEPLLQRSLAIREAALGPNHRDVGYALNSLAILYWLQGLYSQAEPLLQRSLSLLEATLGKSHFQLAPPLNNLALLYIEQGLYDRAKPLLERALAIEEAALGKNHPDVADVLSNLAALYRNQTLYSQSEALQLRALAIREAAVGKNHPDVAYSLASLANLYTDQGLYGKAEGLHKRALAIWEESLGKSHPLVAVSLNNLADLYAAQGLYGRAETLARRALAVRRATLGEKHPDVAISLNNLAKLCLAQHRLADALHLFTSALTLSEGRLRQEALDFSESRLASFLQLLRADEEHLYALLRAHPDNAHVRRLAFTAALLLKGRSVEETTNTSRTILRSLDAQDRDTFERLRGLRTQLAKLSLDGPGNLAPADYQQRLADLAAQGDTLEADLAKRSAPLRALIALPSPTDILDRVAAALPKDGALVEFIAYQDRPLTPKPGTPKLKIQNQLRYLALVVFPDGQTRAVDLGAAAPIDSAAARARDALAGGNAAYQGPAQELYSRAFRPLLPLLGQFRRLFLAPDGQLNLVPFAALYNGQHFLVDTFDLTYLTSGNDLLHRPEEVSPARSVVIFADPDFGSTPAAQPSSPSAAPQLAERSYSVERFSSTLRGDVADPPWVPLPGTRQEAKTLKQLIPHAQLFVGPDATKHRLLHLQTPGILHIATHGFFLDDSAPLKDSRGVGEFGALGGADIAQRSPDPLLRSGLVLAGARAPAASPGDSQRRLDDSLVTALELAGLDLWGTELVVLSACDTGRGDVKLGQGVYGLRRALVVAGAETLVMSLWKVDDQTTQELMEGYYRRLLAGRGRAAALREAMSALREKQRHPHFWAPFIVVGRDAPLQGLAPASQLPPNP